MHHSLFVLFLHYEALHRSCVCVCVLALVRYGQGHLPGVRACMQSAVIVEHMWMLSLKRVFFFAKR